MRKGKLNVPGEVKNHPTYESNRVKSCAMIIKAVQLQRVRILLSKPYHISRGSTDSFRNIVIRIKGGDGFEGIGECDFLSYAANSSIDFAEKKLLDEFIPAIIGMDSMDVEAIIKKLNPGEHPNLGPIAGIDFALWDLNGKALGLPVYKLLGGAVTLDVPVSYTLSIASPGRMAERALEMMEYGYRTFVVKVGVGPIEEDIDRVRMVREAVGSEIKLRLDVNGAYTVDSAIRMLQAVERHDLEYIEQPISPGDIEGLRKMAASTDIPICIDEGLQNLSDAINLVRSGAVRVFNIKPPKCGGLWLSKKIAAIAESAGIPCICGGMLALEITRQASRHFVASTPQACTGYAHEGPGPASQPVTGTLTKGTKTYQDVKIGGGFLQPSERPGLGVDLDNELLNQYLV